MLKVSFSGAATLSAISFGLLLAATPAHAFSVDFSWSGISACQKVSPAFTLSDVPSGTQRLRFAMTDLDKSKFNHGGSVIYYEGDKVAQGAISYIGPCPPDGEHHRYIWVVDALNSGGDVLGRATATQTFPP
jgi:hypothetical protein